MKKVLLVLGLSMLLGACATNRDGVPLLSMGPNQSELAKARTEMTKNAASSSAKSAINHALTKDSRAGLVLIGTVGPMRELDHDGAVKDYQASYSKGAATWHPEHSTPFMMQADYASQVAGWTSVEVLSIPGVINTRVPAKVPNSLAKEISFPSTVASWFVSKTGDLVAGVSNDDGWVFLKKVLCKDTYVEDGGAAYRQCAKDYVRGRFDANSGKELDTSLQPKERGELIDPVSFKHLTEVTTARQ